jgi:hypothetical protein
VGLSGEPADLIQLGVQRHGNPGKWRGDPGLDQRLTPFGLDQLVTRPHRQP